MQSEEKKSCRTGQHHSVPRELIKIYRNKFCLLTCIFIFLNYFFKTFSFLRVYPCRVEFQKNLLHDEILEMEDLFKRWTNHLDSTRSKVNQPPLINCNFCGEHYNDNCHLYSMNNSRWGQELSPYNQYEEERTPNLKSVFEEFMAYHANSKANQNSVQNQEIQFGKSYSMENYRGGQELQPYNQNEEERGPNLDNLLMQFKETTELTH